MKHKLKSEITNNKGAYNKQALKMTKDVCKALGPIIDKNRGRISTTAMHSILIHAVNHEISKAEMGLYDKD